MAEFAPAMAVVLEHEGGFSNDPVDPGGATNFGITAATLGDYRGLGHPASPDEVRALTLDEASQIYFARYWKAAYGWLSDQTIATKTFDLAVNAGEHTAGLVLQRALGAAGWPVVVDGAIGPGTVAAANRCDPVELLVDLCAEQAAYYRDLVQRKPTLEKFLHGWLVRAAWPG